MGEPAETDNARHWKMVGNDFYKAKKYDDAINCYYKAITLDPGYADAWHNMGKAYRNSGDDEKAQTCFSQEKEIRERPAGFPVVPDSSGSGGGQAGSAPAGSVSPDMQDAPVPGTTGGGQAVRADIPPPADGTGQHPSAGQGDSPGPGQRWSSRQTKIGNGASPFTAYCYNCRTPLVDEESRCPECGFTIVREI